MRVLLFTGKGGVGKTTLAAATAAATVAVGRKALVVSTDPAHSLADAFGHELGPEASELDTGLFGAQIDTRRLVDGAWEEMRGHLRTLLAGAGIDELAAEELTALPGVEELLALAEVHRLATTGPWDAVIVDCGPTAETLRLLALPEAVGSYLERLFPTHRRVVRGLLAGVAGSSAPARWDAAADAIGRLAKHLEAVRSLLVDQERTSVRLVLTPERVVAAETRRTLTALALQGIRVDGLVANRLLPDVPDSRVSTGRGAAVNWLRTRRAEQDAVLEELRAAEVPVQTVGYRACEPVGVPALLELAGELYPDGDPLAVSTASTEPLLSVSASETGYQLRVSFPLDVDADLDLARVDDELAITVDGRRRLVALPAALRRCEVTGAETVDGGLLVDFEPDSGLWMR